MAKPGSIFTSSPTSRPSTDSFWMSLLVISVLRSPELLSPESLAETSTTCVTSPTCSTIFDRFCESCGFRWMPVMTLLLKPLNLTVTV